MKKSVYIESLGCVKNQVDSEKMAALIEKSGFLIVDDPSVAEYIIVNTCGFIQSAKEEAVDVLFEMAEYKKTGQCKKLIAAGCFAERYTDAVANEFSSSEVDTVFGIGDISKIVDALESDQRIIKPVKGEDTLIERKVKGYPGTAYLRVSDGCSNHCAYCAIPIIRGELRSRPVEDILKELDLLNTTDLKELVVISQDTTNYGVDRYGKQSLGELLKAIDEKLKDGVWLRVLYMHPDHISDQFLDELKKLKHFVPYFEIPFQSGSEKILKLMGRQGSGKRYLDLIAGIRKRFPDAVFRSTFITGFPGETKEDHNETISFIESAGLDWVGAFVYSPEEGTRAFDFPGKVSEKASKSRMNEIMDVSETIATEKLERFVGVKTDFLVEESVDDSLFIARFWGQAPEVDGVTVLDAFDAVPGRLVSAQIKKLNGKDFFAAGE